MDGSVPECGSVITCPDYLRTFGSGHGLSLHRRHHHPAECHAENTPMERRKARWDRLELVLLARLEMELAAVGVRFINQALHERHPGRTLEAIKGACNSATYREILNSPQAHTAPFL